MLRKIVSLLPVEIYISKYISKYIELQATSKGKLLKIRDRWSENKF